MKTINDEPRLKWDEYLNLEPGTVERTVHNTTSWIQAQTGRIQIDDYWRDIAQQLGVTSKEVQQLAIDFYAGDQLDEDIISYIKILKAEGHAVALLSNDSIELLPKLKGLGIDTLFDPLVVSANIGVIKPDDRAYQVVLNKLGIPAEMAIFIDDRAENIKAAQRLGINTIHYQGGMDLRQILSIMLES